MQNTKQLLSLYGLKWNPFLNNIPNEALVSNPKVDNFLWQVENLVSEGGFALISGESGLGKSVTLRLLAEKLSGVRDIRIVELSRPQSSPWDFYQEIGAAFGILQRVNSRWGGFKALRERWQEHIQSTSLRPILLVDEAQAMSAAVLSELRLLSSMNFDSKLILTTVLCGDSRLLDKLKTPELVPLGTRIRARFTLSAWSKDELQNLLTESLRRAGSPSLMTSELVNTLADRAAGCPRILMNLSNDLLIIAAKSELAQLDEKLFLETLAQEPTLRNRRR